MAAGTIAKPQLRRLLESKIKTAITGACIVSIVTGVAWKFGVSDPRKRQYAEFYKTYDPEAKLKIMCEAGLMESCGPKDF
ncbi:cytochrome c oxidase subunit 6C [Nasonia vitripennis]|uniref:Mitochondrial cytochrome c oxidase subunit VIc/VIIs domain-containing protein n=1 Tax=Nasonia vitripennis TaxID=7425 RepID=A0A7M7Q6D6_NASVI|nr:cytochrome c oxidase subunit 6C [Nasonia vitripennis]